MRAALLPFGAAWNYTDVTVTYSGGSSGCCTRTGHNVQLQWTRQSDWGARPLLSTFQLGTLVQTAAAGTSEVQVL